MEGDGQCMAYQGRLRALYSLVLSEPFLIQRRQQQGGQRSTFTGMRITKLLHSSPDECTCLSFILHFAIPERCAW